MYYYLVANKVGNGIICTFLKSKSISILNSQFITNLLIKESKKLFGTAINQYNKQGKSCSRPDDQWVAAGWIMCRGLTVYHRKSLICRFRIHIPKNLIRRRTNHITYTFFSNDFTREQQKKFSTRFPAFPFYIPSSSEHPIKSSSQHLSIQKSLV